MLGPPNDFSVEIEELTPILKMKRKVVKWFNPARVSVLPQEVEFP